MKIPLTRHGYPELLLFTALFGGAAALAVWAVPPPWSLLCALVPLAGIAFVFNFFRDPERPIPGDDATVVSPADGTVTDVLPVAEAPFVDGPTVRIGIFLSVFDVHVNRAPLAGEVGFTEHRDGLYLDARDPSCSTENEAQDLGMWIDDGEGGRFPILVRQIAGLIARRIVCPVEVGQKLGRGERYGMIKFGSRTELFIPEDRVAAIDVEVGQKVKGGLDAIARIRAGVPAAAAGND